MNNEIWKQRVNRYYNKIKNIIPPEYKDRLSKLEYEVHIIVIVEDACWDSQFYVPILIHLTENNPKINVRLLNKYENIDILERTNGGNKTPYVMFLSEDGYLIDRWVERPTAAYELIAKVRKQVGYGSKNKNIYLKEYRKKFLKEQDKLFRNGAEELVLKILRTHAVQATSPRINEQKETILKAVFA